MVVFWMADANEKSTTNIRQENSEVACALGCGYTASIPLA
jgi:hypothetical protein